MMADVVSWEETQTPMIEHADLRNQLYKFFSSPVHDYAKSIIHAYLQGSLLMATGILRPPLDRRFQTTIANRFRIHTLCSEEALRQTLPVSHHVLLS